MCAFCNLGERSQLGQGELLRLSCPEGFTPQRIVSDIPEVPAILQSGYTPERESGDKSPRGPVTCRRQKSFNKCRHPSMTSEYVDELTIIGYVEEPVVLSLFEPTGYFYVHSSCALWSQGVHVTGTRMLPLERRTEYIVFFFWRYRSFLAGERGPGGAAEFVEKVLALQPLRRQFAVQDGQLQPDLPLSVRHRFRGLSGARPEDRLLRHAPHPSTCNL